MLVTGASDGVGGALIQLCRIRGAIPYAITSESKIDRVKQLGTEAIFLRGQDNFVSNVKQAMGGKDFDVVADVVAGEMFQDLINLLRPEGRYTTAGAFAGPMVQLDLRTVYLKQLEIHGSSQGTRKAFAHLLSYIESGKIKPSLFATYPLSELQRAQTDFMAKNYIGKLVVMPDRFFQPV